MSWRRRKEIRENFEELFRYHMPFPVGPKGPPPPIQPPHHPPGPGDPPGPRRGGPEVVIIEFDDGSGRLIRMSLKDFLGMMGAGQSGSHDASEVPVYAGDLAALLQNEPGEMQGKPTASGEASPLWVRIPQGERGHAIFDTIVRMLASTGAGISDGLKGLLGSAAFQQLFQGDKLTQGATHLLPNNQLLRILLPSNLLAQNPEALKSLLIAEGLPPELIHNIPDRAIAGALQSLLQTSASAGENPLHFLQSVSSVLTLAGVSVQQTQSLLLSLVNEAQKQGLAGNISQGALEQLAARMTAVNNPQLLGLNQLVQESFGKGITQILNSFIRVFMGGALMQGQSAWPQAVPNERMLAELGMLFAAQNKKQTEDRDKKRRPKKKESKIDSVDLDLHPRVERKDVIQEEPEQPQMESIFISLDSED